LIVPIPPIPSQDVKDKPIEARAGNHTNAISSSVGTPHMTVSTSLSRPDRRLTRPCPLRGVGGTGSATTVTT
jgi:hypothetical protein